MTFILILAFLGLVTAAVGKIKGSSFFLWFLIGFVMPVIGLIAAVLYRWERDEPKRQCPGCGRILHLHDQACPNCGRDLFFPVESVPIESSAAEARESDRSPLVGGGGST